LAQAIKLCYGKPVLKGLCSPLESNS